MIHLLTPTLPAADLKALRQSAGLTQPQAAELVGYSLRGWQDAEDGRRHLQPATQALFLLASGQHPTHQIKPR